MLEWQRLDFLLIFCFKNNIQLKARIDNLSNLSIHSQAYNTLYIFHSLSLGVRQLRNSFSLQKSALPNLLLLLNLRRNRGMDNQIIHKYPCFRQIEYFVLNFRYTKPCMGRVLHNPTFQNIVYLLLKSHCNCSGHKEIYH